MGLDGADYGRKDPCWACAIGSVLSSYCGFVTCTYTYSYVLLCRNLIFSVEVFSVFVCSVFHVTWMYFLSVKNECVELLSSI